MAAYKPVGVNEDSLFPPRVMAGLDDRFANRARSRKVINVVEYGMVGDDSTDNAPILNSLLTDHAGAVFVVEPGKYRFNSKVTPPNTARSRIELDDGAEFIAVNGESIIDVQGDAELVGPLTSVTGPVSQGFKLSGSSVLAPEDYVFIESSLGLSGTNARIGGIFRVRTVDHATGAISTDIPSWRRYDPAENARAHKLNLHVGIEIYGGHFYSITGPTNTSSLIYFRGALNPVVKGTEIGPHSHVGITVNHTVGGYIDCDIHDLTDDLPNGNVGYGVNCGGGARDLIVRGSGRRTRHAFTTNSGGPLGSIGSGSGEPYNIDVSMTTADCTNKALDTHRSGYNIHLDVHNSGGQGAVQVRADNVRVTGFSHGANYYDFTTGSLHTEPAIFDGCVSVNVRSGDRMAFAINGPAILRGCSTRLAYRSFVLNADNIVLDNCVVRGTGGVNGSGITLNASNIRVLSPTIENTGTGIFEESGTNNEITNPKFIGVGDEYNLRSYSHPGTIRSGPVKSGTPTTMDRYVEILDQDGNAVGYVPVYRSAS